MAAPYVAAASVIVRQAMHRAGQNEVSQDAIESVMRSTADTTFDPITGQSYLRLNLARAVDTIMPDEESVPPTTPTTTTPTTTTSTTTATTTPTTTTTDVVVDYVQPVTFPPRSGQTIFRIGATRERASWIGRRSWDWSIGRGTGVADTSTLSAGRASIRARRLNTSFEREAASFDAVHAQAVRDTTDVAAADNVYTEIGR
jgi:hypothetical protein